MTFEGSFNGYMMGGPFPLEPVVHQDGSHNLTMYYDSYNYNILGNDPSDYSLTFDQSNNASLISLNDVNNARNNLGTTVGCFDNTADSSFHNFNQQSMEGIDNQFMVGQTHNNVYPRIYSSANQMLCGQTFPSNNFSNVVEEHDNLLLNHSVNIDGSSADQANQTIVSRRPWTAEEDQKLVDLVNLRGEKEWSRIAQAFSFRIGKQCRERWYNYLRPGIKKDPWSEEEDRVLIEAHLELGNKWSAIAKHLPGRTVNSIKNRWNANKRKRSNNNFRHRRCRTGSSLLENYMQSLARFPAADEGENMPDGVQQFKQISNDGQGGSSSGILSNSGIDMGIEWSEAMLSSLMMAGHEE